jgi:Domain of unknown function (DUF5664)
MSKPSKNVSNGNYRLTDTGKRHAYETGALRENAPGKGRYDLISPIFLRRLAIVFEKGAEKYADRNWEKGIPLGKYLDSALRHIEQVLEGQDNEDHAAQASWNLCCFIHTKEMIDRGILPEELNDLPNYQEREKK